MKVLVILLVLVGIVGSLVISQNAYAISLGMSSDRIMETQEIILLGNVDSVKYNTDHTEYTISVLEYVKTSDNFDKTNSLQAIGCGENQTGGCITFELGQRVLFVLNEREKTLIVSDLSFVAPNPDCSVDDYFKLNDAKSGLHILQNNQTEHFFTGEPINLTFYAYNKNLDDSNYNVTIDYYRTNNNVVFSKTFEGQFEECIPNVKLETSFTPSEMGKYGNRYTTSYGDNQSVWGFPIIERDSSPLQQFKHGVNTNHILCHNDLVLIQKYDGTPACVTESTKTKLIERGWTGEKSTETLQKNPISDIEKLLIENKINYNPDKLVVTTGVSIRGDPGCGAVVDITSKTHWFGIDSMSNPSELTLYTENPNQCVVNVGGSCFCNAQMKLATLTLDELDYFTPQEQEKYANILIDYLYKENINRTPKFMIGKHNVNYTDPSAIGYCGKIWGTATRDHFSGTIVNGVIENYRVERELPLLCAISDDAQYFGKTYGE